MKKPSLHPQATLRQTRFPFFAFVLGLLLMAACGAGQKRPEPQAASAEPEGAAVYTANCSRCHLPDGEGVAGMAPAMEDSPAVKDENPRELIRAVLYGVGGKSIRGQHYPSRMPGFSQFLKDEEIAAVVNYSRVRWGRGTGRVTATDIQKERLEP